MLHVRAETTDTDAHLCALEFAELTWKLKKFQSLLKRYVEHRLIFLKRCELRLLFSTAVADLNHRTETSDLDGNSLSGLWMHTEDTLSNLVLETHIVSFLHLRMEHLIEIAYLLLPSCLTLGHEVETLFEIGREIEIKHIGEVFCQEVVDNNACVGRDKFTLVGPDRSLRGLRRYLAI